MAKCRDCRHLDLTQKTHSGLCTCTNLNRKMQNKWGGVATASHMKAPWADACKTGFEPREEGEGLEDEKET